MKLNRQVCYLACKKVFDSFTSSHCNIHPQSLEHLINIYSNVLLNLDKKEEFFVFIKTVLSKGIKIKLVN